MDSKSTELKNVVIKVERTKAYDSEKDSHLKYIYITTSREGVDWIAKKVFRPRVSSKGGKCQSGRVVIAEIKAPWSHIR